MTRLTVATINVRNRTDRWLKRRHLLVAQLLDSSPDLIGFQELHFPIGQGRWLRNQVNVRLSGSSRRPYRLIQKRRRSLVSGYAEGIGILSRLPVLYHDVVSLGYGGRIALRVSVELPSHQMLDFVSVHLHSNPHDREARQEQVMKLVGWLNEIGRAPLQVVAGDFNETPDGPAIQTMKQTYCSAYERMHGREPLATFPTVLAHRADGWAGCLDYIFLSSAVRQIHSAAIFCDKPAEDDDTLYPSDHVGVIATLEV